MFVLILWFAFITIRDRRRGRRPGGGGRAATDLTALYLLVLPGALYVRATRILGRRGYRVPALQQAAWFGGLALIGVALLSPLDSLGETDLLSAHMAQHLLIADLSAPLLVIGLRSPVYAFLLPRSMFVRARALAAAARGCSGSCASRGSRRRSGS